MRGMWLIVVGISALACKGNDKAPPPATPPPTPAKSVPAATAQVQAAPPAPRLDLDEAFEAETEDKAWADATEKAIQAVAPDLSNVTCLQHQCRATLTASTQEELVDRAEALQTETSLRGLGTAKNVLLTGAETGADGKLAMKIYVRFDR